MNLLQYFFRGELDNYIFPYYGGGHLVFLAIIIIGSAKLYIKKEDLKASPLKRKKIEKTLFLFALMDQIIFYLWAFSSGFFTMEESLPLYTCRTALLALILAYALSSSKAKAITLYWGIIGGVLGLLVPDLFKFHPPHFTNVDFVIKHVVLLWSACYFLFVDEYQFNQRDYRFILLFTNVFLILAEGINILYDANYAYLRTSPFMPATFSQFPPLIYTLMVFLFYNFLMFLIHHLGLAWNHLQVYQEKRA